MEIQKLIDKYELERKVVLELIQKSENTENCFKELAVERFLKQFITDLRALAKVNNENSALNLADVISRFDSNVFTPPFRLGKNQNRAILDAKGNEVIIMPSNSEKQAQMYCDYLNGL